MRAPMRILAAAAAASLALVFALVVAGAGSAATDAGSGANAAAAPSLQLITEPQAGSAPFVALIAGARHSVTLTMYELTDPVIERALAAAAGRGVDVQVLLNGGYYSEAESTNRAADAYLAAHRVHVRYAPRYFALTHQKTLTVDGTTAVITTLNFDGEYATTRDFAVIDRQPADVHAIVATFDDDYAAKRTTPSSGTGDLIWSPGAAPAFLSAIGGARHSIEVENEEMAYGPATDALCAAARRGVDVRIVMTYASDWRAAFDQLDGCGAHIRLYHGQRYYIHAKLLVVDGREALLGSQNFSTTSLDDNRELSIRVTNATLVDQLAGAFESDYAGAG
jgi:cardiolipin synthase